MQKDKFDQAPNYFSLKQATTNTVTSTLSANDCVNYEGFVSTYKIAGAVYGSVGALKSNSCNESNFWILLIPFKSRYPSTSNRLSIAQIQVVPDLRHLI